MTAEQIRSRLKDKVVGIAGCGGLGSNCAVALARVGIGKLVLADFDRVEEGNLNRQYFLREQIGDFKAEALRDIIHRIDENISIETHVVNLDPESIGAFFSDCDLIVEAFDTDHAKVMIIETVLDEMPDKYIISGQGLAGYGNNEAIQTRRHGKLLIVGDGGSPVSDDNPPLGPRVGIVANMQANLALEVLLNED
ncbi:MAG: sulfur carrier protein ThiS adenylyltransferase ThiF [Bacteroidales bacterium]|jgi:sulfur carrier protein ThiS adenylyltransferase|nr:sulfur carrier protein ThiS adenylyltransferase ThiF [Bacteroidales bacterium]